MLSARLLRNLQCRFGVKALGCTHYAFQECNHNDNRRYRSTEAAVLPKSESVKQPADFKKERQLKRAYKKKQHVSFIKQLFVGRYDKDVLTFPEVLDSERLDTLQEMVQPVEKYFEKIDGAKIDTESKIGDDVLEVLKSFGLFGMQIPTDYGGLGLNATEYARLSEVIAINGSIATTLAAHQAIGLKGILIAGTEAQKAKYLPKLATGEKIAAFCLTEPGSGSDAASIQTKATLSEDGKHYLLNGEKQWITNGGIADVFTVFAKTKVENPTVPSDNTEKVTAFIVERNFGGIVSGKPENKLGIRGSNTTSLHFENTPVPIENVLGKVGEGFKMAVNILNSGRFSMGASVAGAIKKLMETTVDHAINRKQFGKQIKDFGMIQEKIAKVASLTYAMESMAYLTAGIIDSTETPDCAVEAAAVKIFSSEAAWFSVSECLQILGGLGYMKDYPYERSLRDTRILLIFEGTNEILRLFIALMGAQYAGRELNDVVRKLRNPFMNPGFVVKTIWANRRQMSGRPKLNLDLAGHLHPTLRHTALDLEYCVLRFQYAVELVLSRYGKNIVEEQLQLKRLADVAIDLFAMSAVLSRSSRSYCIGLQNCEHEVTLAKAFCYDATNRAKANVEEVISGPIITNDRNYAKIASTIFKNNGYCAEHPLTRNWKS